jgi:hypothetical protein
MMRRLLMIPAMLCALVLASCAGTDFSKFGSNVGSLLTAATTTVVNPVSATNIYQVEQGHAATRELAVSWRRLCWSEPYAALMAKPATKFVCENRRTRLRAIEDADLKTESAIADAKNFVRDHPTLSATTVLSAAYSALKNFQKVTPVLN